MPAIQGWAPTYRNGDDFRDNEDDDKDDQKDHLGILAANYSASTPFSTLATPKSFKEYISIKSSSTWFHACIHIGGDAVCVFIIQESLSFQSPPIEIKEQK